MKKSKKKFVLAGLVLLAVIITGLALTGCETEVDPSTPQQEQTDGNTANSGGGNTQQPGGDNSGNEDEVGGEKPVTYTVTFNKNAEDATGEMASQTFTAGVAQKLTDNGFSRTNYGFAGWAESADGAVKYTDGQEITVTGNTHLYAKWGVASVRTADGTITPYDTFDSALDAAMGSTGSTLALLADINMDSTIGVAAGDFTLDLNGKAIISSATTIVMTSDSASLTVTDTSAGQTGAIKPDSDTAKSATCIGIEHFSSGTLRIEGGSITAASSVSNSSYGVYNYSSCTVEITGGTIAGGETAGEYPSAGVCNSDEGNVIISGSPTIVGDKDGSEVSASFQVRTADTSAITLEKGFAPTGTPYSVYIGIVYDPVPGIFAKPGTDATLDASWFTSYDTSDPSKFTVEKDGNNLKLVTK